jgi:Tol biopolymer transport system component
MPLAAGDKIGPYEILAPIGAGGMGEVYRARDTKLKREVAIKVLPETFARDPERMARFQREAEVLASLNHPNIAAIYGVEDRALVMELVEGESPKGPLPFDDAWKIASQIAAALEYAHDKGIVHRDLKPANIKITPEGVVKLLDFGLAKAFTNRGEVRTSASDSPENSPTLTVGATEVGVILGTAAYMSPEQAKGKTVDKRADIWSFGVVLYELLTAERLFKGEDVSETLAQVLTKQPDWEKVPPKARRLLRECLEKDPKQRLRDIGDVWLLLANTPAPEGRERPAAVSRASLAWVVAAVFAIATAAVSFVHFREMPPVAHVVTRFRFPLPEGQNFTQTGRHDLAISPDGTKLAYVANQKLYLRAMDQLEAQPVRGTNEDPMEPVFSPDGQWLAYFAPAGGAGAGNAGGVLRKIAVTGGAPVTLGQLAAAPYGITWRNGTIAFAMNADKVYGVQAIPDTGGTPRTLVNVDPKKEIVAQPQLLADGKHVLFAVDNSGREEGRIVVQAIAQEEGKERNDGKDRRTLVNSGADPRALPAGQLVYIHEGTLLAVPFDIKRLAVTGGPVPLVEGVTENTPAFGQYAVSSNGTLAFMPGAFIGAADQRTLVWVDRQGHEESLPAKARSYVYPRLSPDGTKIAVNSRDEEKDIWVFDLAKATLTRLTFGPAYEYHPVWTPDNRYLFFSSSQYDPPSPADLLRKAADGTGPAEVLTKPLQGGYPLSLTPDGVSLVFRRFSPTRGLFVLPLQPRGEARALIADPRFTELNGEISPDGRWIAYDSDESGRREIYVRPFPAVDRGRWLISSEGGSDPLWSRSGRELFFMTAASRMVAVPVPAGPGFTYGKPQSLFDATAYNQSTSRPFDISVDGKRFLMVKNHANGSAAARPSIVVVSHWFDDVNARMPAER